MHPVVGLLDHNFLRNLCVPSTVAVLIYIPTSGVQGFLFPTALPELGTFHVLYNSRSDSSEGRAHCGFIYFSLSYFHCIPGEAQIQIMLGKSLDDFHCPKTLVPAISCNPHKAHL